MNKYDINSYSAPLIELIKSDHKLSTPGIEKIINKLHSADNMDNIRDIISILLYLVSKNNISCNNEQQYYESIKKLVISSKNTTINKQVKVLLDKLLTAILNQYNMNYDGYTDVRKSQFRAAVIYLLSEILYKHICIISHGNI
jgi:ribosomal protein L17